MTDDERRIRDVVATWMEASKAGDIATVLDLMTDDAIFMIPGGEPFGKSTFAANAESMKNVRMEGTAAIEEVQVSGDWAYLRNRIEIAVTPPGGAIVRRSGYSLTIMRREADGRWRLARDANLLAEDK